MMITEENLKGISCFVATVECGSFSAAAGRLNLTGSAVSKSVARLESRLGSRLLDRTTRRMALTDAGQAYYDTCQRILSELSETEAMLAAQRRIPAGRLHIALPQTFGRKEAMPLLNRFASANPELRLTLAFSDRFLDLFDEGVDLAVRIGGPLDYPQTLSSMLLGMEKRAFFAAPDYLERHPPVRNVEDLPSHRAIVYQLADGSHKAWRIVQENGQAVDRPAPWRMAVGDGEAQLSAVKAGLGVAQMATWLTREAEAAGELVRLLPERVVEGLPLMLVWPRKKTLTPKMEALLAAMQALRIE
ncbi:LysR family transcriptional regulator [Franconibacter pulveris]